MEKYLEAASRKYPANLLLHSARAVLAALQKNEAATDRAIENAMTNRRSFGHFHHAELDIACALALFGHDDEAIERLTSTVHGGFPCLPAIEGEPLLESLRDDARYIDITRWLREQRDHYARVFAELRPMLPAEIAR